MQLLIDNGFEQDVESGGWTCKRLFAYAVGDEVKVRTHNDCRNWDYVHINDPEGLQKLLDELFKNNEPEQDRLVDYAAGVAKVCNENAFPVRYAQRAGKVEFFYNGQQSGVPGDIFLFSIDLSRNWEFFFTTPDCVVYAEDNPLETEVLEVLDVMHTETNYDRHCDEGANLHNVVWQTPNIGVYSYVTHALANCLRYGVGRITHQVAQVAVEDNAQTNLCQAIMRSAKFPEVHAYAFHFLSENCNGPVA